MNLLFASVAGLTLLCLLCLVAMPFFVTKSSAVDRLKSILQPEPASARLKRRQLRETVSYWTAAARQLSGLQESEQTKEKLHAAGLRTTAQMDGFLAVRWVTPIAGIFAASFIRSNTLFACILLAAAGYLMPDIWLRRRIRTYKESLRRSLPDALDLMNICVEAGLGLDQAMLRVSDELALSHPELQSEFQRVQLEQRVGSTRMDAWKRFAARAHVEEISSLVGMLAQSEKFGTPISRALSRFADDLRSQRRQRAEEAAAKTRIKIVFPLVFFIFPCLFVVLLAPAILGLFGAIRNLQ